MSTTTTSTELESRILREGYGPGAWHGADLKAALSDVNSAQAFQRPASGRHNIAEIALHHAYCTRAVTAQLSGAAEGPFVLEGEDWFDLPDEKKLSWSKIQATVESEQSRLASAVAEIATGKRQSPIPETERFNLLLGITCHAVYHAGQVQLIKKLAGA
jgi:hypothetical protein